MSEQTYRIKPLVWVPVLDEFVEEFSAPAIGGVYKVMRPEGSREWWWMFYDGRGSVPDSYGCRTAEEGMAAAEEHWRNTMTRFLEEVGHE